MNKLFGLSLLTLLTTSSWAGSIGPDDIGSCCDWSGFYVGINLGGIRNHSSGPVTVSSYAGGSSIFPASSQEFISDKSSFFGGGHIGYNWQNINGAVFGTEFSIDGMNLHNPYYLTAAKIPQGSVYVAGDSFTSKNNLQAAWVARIGMGLHTWLLYALGGVAISHPQLSVNFIETYRSTTLFPQSSGSSSKFLVGSVAGGGIEYDLSQNFTVGVEYRYVGYGKRQYPVGTVAVYAPTPTTFIYAPVAANMNFSTNQLALKFNYKFA